MNGKLVRISRPDQPITITPARERIAVTVAGRRVVDTREALTVKKAGYPPVHYIPRKDFDLTEFERASIYSSYKGTFFSRDPSLDAVWTYDAALQVQEYLAFYPDGVDAMQSEGKG